MTSAPNGSNPALDPSFAPLRVRYYENQLLRLKDFEAEQAYHMDRLRRASKALFTPGRIEGLAMAIEGERLTVQPGVAVDRDGRWLVLRRPADRATTSGDFVGLAWDDETIESSDGGTQQADRHVDADVVIYTNLKALDDAGAVHLGSLTGGSTERLIKPGPLAGLRLTGDADGPAATLRMDKDALRIEGETPGQTARPLTYNLKDGGLTVNGPLKVTGSVTMDGLTVDARSHALTFENTVLMKSGLEVIEGQLTAREGAAIIGKPLEVTAGILASELRPLEGRATLDIIGGALKATGDLVVEGNSTMNGKLTVDKMLKTESTDVDQGPYVEVNSGKNPLRFTPKWSTFPDHRVDAAEISNNTEGNYRGLIIAGNKSDPDPPRGGRRQVIIFDDLQVIGTLDVGASTRLGRSLIVSQNGELWIRFDDGFWVFRADGSLLKVKGALPGNLDSGKYRDRNDPNVISTVAYAGWKK